MCCTDVFCRWRTKQESTRVEEEEEEEEEEGFGLEKKKQPLAGKAACH